MAPELRDLVHREGLDPATLHIGMPVDDLGHFLHRTDRRQIMVSDSAGKKGAVWTPTSLRALFRGEKSPPDLSRYPEEYVPHFYAIEFFVAMLFKLDRPRSDQEMEEVCMRACAAGLTARVSVKLTIGSGRLPRFSLADLK